MTTVPSDEPPKHGGLSGPGVVQPHSDHSGAKIVLVVGEDAETREILTRYLIRQDLIAMPVRNGAQALAVCETVLPDAVVIDLPLEDPEGLALIGDLKAQYPRTTLVVVLSGAPGDDREDQCRAKGADDVLTRPIQLEHLGPLLSQPPDLRGERFPGRAPLLRSSTTPRGPGNTTHH